MENEIDRIVAFCLSLLLFTLSSCITSHMLFMGSPEYGQYHAIEQIKRAHEQAQDWREFEEAIAGSRPAESLKDSKSIEFVQLVRVIHTDSSAKGAAVVQLMSLQRGCSAKNQEHSQDCDKLDQAFALLASERFDRLVKGDTSALTPVASLPAENETAKKPAWRMSPANLGISWLFASFISIFILLFVERPWPKWVSRTAWILFFPPMFVFRILFRPFKTARAMRTNWLLYRRKKLARKIEHDLADLWPRTWDLTGIRMRTRIRRSSAS